MRGLRDSEARARIAARVRRLAFGNAGDSKSIGAGVSELRIHHGPGYRVYFVKRGKVLFVLLCGGDKSSQAKDIVMAKRLAAELKD
jgi:putative addiction module killer protein